MKCYVAGPMRGIEIANFPAFFHAEGQLKALGWDVINPARINCEAWFAGHGMFGDENAEGRRYYARADINQIIDRLRSEDGDAIVVLPGWENSTGATAEVAVGKWCGLAILTLADAIAPRTVHKLMRGLVGHAADLRVVRGAAIGHYRDCLKCSECS